MTNTTGFQGIQLGFPAVPSACGLTAGANRAIELVRERSHSNRLNFGITSCTQPIFTCLLADHTTCASCANGGPLLSSDRSRCILVCEAGVAKYVEMRDSEFQSLYFTRLAAQ